VTALALAVLPSPAAAADEPPPVTSRAVVAQDGSGDFRTIQAALDAVPSGHPGVALVLVRSGTYREKLFVRTSRIALVGEDRGRTVVVFDQLRREWRKAHENDWGAAVVNVADDVTDLLLANLTIRNDHGAATGDRDHQFAVRSGGASNRIVLLHANVLSEGGDTLSLWNADDGMSYQAGCTFEGWVDFVCPRGWSYVTGSRFVAHGPTAAIWHDGSRNRDMRFVVRRSTFEGDPGFPLGRCNRDGQFFVLDARFSGAMADRPIYRPSAPESYRWPPRAYFWACHREGGDFPWFADNLREAEGAPRPREVTAAWTFGGRWDPEGSIPAVLPFAAVPRPEHGDQEVAPCGTLLRWAPARDAEGYRVSFGPAGAAPKETTIRGPRFDPGPMEPSTAYLWKVDVVRKEGILEGEAWSFKTAPRPVRIVLAGDSTVTDEIGWGLGFREHLSDRVECLDLARNGRSSKSYRSEGLWAEALEARPDVILIQFGHNDQPGKGEERETDLETEYRPALERFVDEAREAGALPVLVTPLARRIWSPDAATLRPDLEPWAAAVREAAASCHVPLVDLHARSRRLLEEAGPAATEALGPTRADGTVDKTHLSRQGSALFGAIVAEELARAVPALAGEIR
jgi:lysophospholipase L1-like esterase